MTAQDVRAEIDRNHNVGAHRAGQRNGYWIDESAIHQHHPSCNTGVNTPGMAIEARTALSVEPLRSQISAPLCSAVATAAKGIFSSSIGRSATLR